MAVITVDAYGAPSYGPLRGVEGIVGHSPENADPTLAAAIAIARWQATASNTSGGSYHGILGHDSSRFTHSLWDCTDSSHWTMVRSVPWNQAAGGIATVRTNPPWDPGRYPWIQSLLSSAAYSDPNAYLQQIAISGKAAQYVQYGYPKGLLISLAEWIIVLEGAYRYDAVLTLHRFWQTNRTDPGPVDLWDKVLVEYARLKDGSPEPSPDLQARIDSLTAELTAANTAKLALEGRITQKDARIASALTKLNGAIADLNAAKGT